MGSDFLQVSLRKRSLVSQPDLLRLFYMLENPERRLHLLPVDDQKMMDLFSAAAFPDAQALCELSAETLEKALCEADAGAKEKSNDWIRRAVTSKTVALNANAIIDKCVAFLSEGAAIMYIL